jgi:hypothetical protein
LCLQLRNRLQHGCTVSCLAQLTPRPIHLGLTDRLWPCFGVFLTRQRRRINETLVSFLPMPDDLYMPARGAGYHRRWRYDRVEAFGLGLRLSRSLRPGRPGDVPQLDVTPREAPTKICRQAIKGAHERGILRGNNVPAMTVPCFVIVRVGVGGKGHTERQGLRRGHRVGLFSRPCDSPPVALMARCCRPSSAEAQHQTGPSSRSVSADR